MRLRSEPRFQCSDDPRLPDAGFARDEHNFAVLRLGAFPPAQQQADFLAAADQRGERQSA
jgi:hypothetical protein